MPRLTSTQAATLADWWPLVQHAGFGGFTTTDLTVAARSIATEAGVTLSFETNTALATLYGYARRMSNAADMVQSALDSDTIIADHIAVPPWARDETVMNTAPIWHVSFQFTYLDQQGIQQTDYRTSVFEMTLPDTIGDLKDAITEDAQAMADKYRFTFVDAQLNMILAVLPMRTVPIHNLRPNETTWTPPAVAYFDTETRNAGDADSETHTLRCWSARLIVRRDSRKTVTWQDDDNGELAADLATTIESWAHKHQSLWVYAHNLSFDLTTTALTSHLAESGWSVTGFAVDSPSPFARMANGRRTLTFADSFSWLPVALEQVASQLGTSKVPLPAADDSMAAWLARCDSDVAILAEAMGALMDWWDARQLGRWSLTGTASGWNAMRHRIDARRFTINPDPAGLASDRAAVYGGRRGVAVTGRLPFGRYAELDFTSAYPQVAASLPLPLERMASFDRLPPDHRWLGSDRHGVIAEVTLRTDVPRWPARVGRHVWYPVGDFTTTLAGPDIAEAASIGALVSIGAGYVHRLGYALKPWADWCLALARGEDAGAPAIAAVTAKHWGRAEIGKWAQRSFNTVEIGPAPTRGWDCAEGWNHSAGVRATIIDFDGRRWQASASGDADNCYPAVLAWVESYVRVRLGRLIDALPAGAVIAWDTDGLLVDLKRAGDFGAVAGLYTPLAARVKNRYTSVEIIGPQHMILDGRRRFAGIPASATDVGDGRLSATLWPKIGWQMANSQPGTYVRPVQDYRVAATYAPGWVLADSTVVPIELARGQDEANLIVPWPATRYAAGGAELGAQQNAHLERYRRDTTKPAHHRV